ncbi:methylase of chemotaxis methyl-accepting protein [Desulfosporosinus acidiphilus SJ4]|uniref:protein-glutamate O-methyltransferase n=1 Tax=Desulfosporosinus acidiphilus (strain DSM 22704 / JCM 16185 / SJ4) TaxID=646529 RepID=I4D271_DESAJ|nr:protein-glutamate O-methyltransferase CheR [Desulfosporosinus acidiphilus]AFM39895.1 methylase of chemotaxis methyl-accepting protein [Desulfosporosinus acidiphilus SJ4]
MKLSIRDFKQLAELIHVNYGIYLKEEKIPLVEGRLRQVLVDQQFESYAEYIDYLKTEKTGHAIQTLINKITTNHTFFMRETDHFNFFREEVLPELLQSKQDKDLRIWSAGCSSGEEPYTLAMIIDEVLGEQKKYWDARILATDLSQQVLESALQGVYSKDKVDSLPPNWRLKYFSKLSSDEYSLTESLRQEVIFRKFNLMEEVFPFRKKFDVIFCRNVMIYFDMETKKKLVEKFYDITNQDGYLFIGHSESVNRSESKYHYIRPAVYRKL